jgi:hypothetical protein
VRGRVRTGDRDPVAGVLRDPDLLRAVVVERQRDLREIGQVGGILPPVGNGDPASYLTLEPGTEVVSAERDRVGVVEHVLRDEEEDIFDGLVIDVRLGPGGLHFVDAPQVAEIHASQVVLSVSSADVERLPKPAPNPAVMEHHGVEDSESPIEHKLRRAWDIISGRG